MTVESLCHTCDKPWPLACRCEGDAQRPRPAGYLPQGPGIEHVIVETELVYRGRSYRAQGTFAIYAHRGQRPAYPKADVLSLWREDARGWQQITPSPTLIRRANSDLRLALDMELRRRNPDWHDRALNARQP